MSDADFIRQCEGCGRFDKGRERVNLCATVTVSGMFKFAYYLPRTLSLCPECRGKIGGSMEGRTDTEIRQRVSPSR